MISAAQNYQYVFTLKTADDYRIRGYHVQEDVALDFFPDYRADLLATKDGDKKVVLLRTRTQLAADGRLFELSEIIKAKPGWSFNFILLPEPGKLSSPEGARPFEQERIDDRRKEVQKALDADMPETAFLLAWSAAEAVLRDILAADGIAADGITTTEFILNQAVYEGVMSHDSQCALKRFQKYRNAIVHGFTMNDFSEDLVTELVETIRRIEEEAALDDRSNGQAYSTN